MLPPAASRLLLPAPHPHMFVLMALACLPIVLVVLFAVFPQIDLSGAVSRGLVFAASALFVAGMVALCVFIAKLFYDLLMNRSDKIDHDKHVIGVLMLFTVSVLIFSVTLYYLQPQ